MKHVPAAMQTLKTKFDQQFSVKGSVSLFVGLACNLAFIGQTYFWPAMWHTSVFTVSYTDASYVGQLLCALMLAAYFKKTHRITLPSSIIWISALLVQATLIVYYFLFTFEVSIADPVHWLFGGLFGVYLPIALVSWIALFIGHKPTRIMWNIMLSAIFSSFAIWLFSGLDGLKICTSMGVFIIIATAIVTSKLKSNQAQASDNEPTTAKYEYSYSAPAMFLFSLAFVIAVSFAGIEGEHASFATGAFFAPMLVICVLLLFVDNIAFPLSNIAAPAIVIATIATSSLHFDPALTFDIAALGMFLFLTFAVVLLCSSNFGEKQAQIHEFLYLMVAFASGCLAGRAITAACTAWAVNYATGILTLVSIIAAFTSMIILIRKGITLQRTQQLFTSDEADTTEDDHAATQQNRIEHIARTYNLGERETEVLLLLLQGDSASDIARKLIIANGTAKSHIRHVYKKLGIHNRPELFALFSVDAPAKYEK